MGKQESDSGVLEIIREGYNLPDVYFDVDVRKAGKKEDIKTVLDLEQLTGKRFESFYVDTDDVRESDTISSLRQLLSDSLNPYVKKLFSGFTGSGKTTELIKLCFRLKEKSNIIIFSAWNRLKIDMITVESLIFEIVGDLLGYMYTNQLADESNELLKDIVESITNWLFETEIVKEKEKTSTRTLAAGLQWLKGVFFSAKLESRTGKTDKTRSTRIEERKINDLIFECNKIFDYLKEQTGRDTLIIIDDLEKMSFVKAREFYVRNSSFIRDFRCKMVLTIPVELIFHSDYAVIQNVFGEAEVLPMIKIKDKDGNDFKAGIDCLTRILSVRLELSLFENNCYREGIRYSGGAIRELFRIIQRAALVEKSDIITEVSMQRSINHYKDVFASRIQERDDEIKITFEEYMDILFDIHGGNKIAPRKNNALLDLLRTRAVMKYNGEGFYDTHPLLDSFIEAYKKKNRKKGS